MNIKIFIHVTAISIIIIIEKEEEEEECGDCNVDDNNKEVNMTGRQGKLIDI